MEESLPKNSTKSYLSAIAKSITDFGNQLTDDTLHLLRKQNAEDSCVEYLFDPHATLQRTYGSVSPFGDGDPSGPSCSPDSRRGSAIGCEPESIPSDEDSTVTPPPNIVCSSPLPEFEIENETYQNKENKFNIPIINIHPEQDFNFLTVDAAKFNARNGRGSPGRRSSGFLSGSISPLTITSSYEFQNQELLTPEKFTWTRILKIIFLVGIFLVLAGVIIITTENEVNHKLITVSSENPYEYSVHFPVTLVAYYPVLTLEVIGAFPSSKYENYTTDKLMVEIVQRNSDGSTEVVSETWEILFFDCEKFGKIVPEKTVVHGFNLDDIDYDYGSRLFISFRTNTANANPFSVSGRLLSDMVEAGAVLGGVVMIGLYILIIFELVNRTLAAMLAAVGAIACLAAINERPTTVEMVSWLDMETLILLFSMMVIVAILCETGFFDYSSYLMYKLASGQVWPLITAMCFFTAFISAFLDNVTTILLMTPVTIRICEAMELNPVPVLISIVIFSNIGGAITPVGDPPNVIIANNKDVIKAGIDFNTFSLHMLLGIIPVLIIGYVQLRFIFRSNKSLKFSEPYDVTELRREIDVWSRAADSLSSYSKDERQVKSLLLAKVVHLRGKLKSKIKMGGQSEENFQANLIDLEASCKIRDWGLLIKCAAVMTVIIILFFLHSIPQLNLSIGWTALLGTVFLLILADRREVEGILCRVEWSTLIFFSALFIVMEGVSRLGLLEWIGNQTEAVIMEVNEDARLTVAILLILWVSGLASAFIDNIPFTTMMIKIVTRVAEQVSLPLQPLVWALALGTCLGGNGTLIGASANVVSAGIAEQHGYKFTFMEYFKIGFPMMLVSLLVSTFYLIICHTVLQWNY